MPVFQPQSTDDILSVFSKTINRLHAHNVRQTQAAATFDAEADYHAAELAHSKSKADARRLDASRALTVAAKIKDLTV